jgi:hypothetical protein
MKREYRQYDIYQNTCILNDNKTRQVVKTYFRRTTMSEYPKFSLAINIAGNNEKRLAAFELY